MEVTPERYPISAKLEHIREDAQIIHKFLNWANGRTEYAFGESMRYDEGECDCEDGDCHPGTYVHGDRIVDIGDGVGPMITQEAILRYFEIDINEWNREQERIRADVQLELHMQQVKHRKSRGNTRQPAEEVGVTDLYVTSKEQNETVSDSTADSDHVEPRLQHNLG